MSRSNAAVSSWAARNAAARAWRRRVSNLRRRWARLRDAFSSELWPVPLAAIVVAVVAGILLPILDAAVDSRLSGSVRALLFNGGPDSARAVLSTISGSLITATSLTFSLTVVALQLASSQASPRLLRLFSSDRLVHGTLATFLGTFAFSLTVLRTVQNKTDSTAAAVPSISITLCLLLTLTSVVMLTVFLAHLAKQLRVETMLRNVHRETRRTIALVESTTEEGLTEIPAGTRPEKVTPVAAERSGFLTSTSRSTVIALATRFDLVVEEERSVGASVIAGVPLASWWPRTGTMVQEEGAEEFDPDAFASGVRSAYVTSYERTSTQDIGFGLRQLVDIAIRALSPGINDPTTAEHALSHISAVLCSIVKLPSQPAGLLDDDGELRLIVRPHRFEDLLELGMGQPRRYGAGDPAVAVRLFQLLRDIALNTKDARHREAIRQQCTRLQDSVAHQNYDDAELARFDPIIESVQAALAGANGVDGEPA